jgi:hypothetical protein
MPSQIWTCAVHGCAGHILANNLLDLLVPLFLDFLLFTLVAERILRRLEERRWRPARALLLTRLVRVADRLMIDLTPPGLRQLTEQTIRVGGVSVERLFAWSSPTAMSDLDIALSRDLAIKLPRIRAAIARARDSISTLPQSVGGHLSSHVVQQVINLDASLQHGIEVTDAAGEAPDADIASQVVAALSRIVHTCELLVTDLSH